MSPNGIIKSAMNGARLPNWFWLAVGLIGTAFNAGITWRSKEDAVTSVKTEMRVYAAVDSARTYTLFNELDARANRRNRETNSELKALGTKVGYIARAIE